MQETAMRLGKVLLREKVMDMGSIKEVFEDRSRRSLFRDLVAVGYRSSYTHAGQYYTLRDVPVFDDYGLWFHEGIGFSRAGTLKATLAELIGQADAGHTHHELESIVRVRVHNTLLSLARESRVGRRRVETIYVYVSAVSERAAEQVTKREQHLAAGVDATVELPDAMVVEVLVEVVQVGKVTITPCAVAQRLRARKVPVSERQAEQVFARYGLGGPKKGALSSGSTRSPP